MRADVTLSIQLPKLSFFFPENEDIVGEWELLNIGLKTEFIETVESSFFTTEEVEIRNLIKPRKRFAHKSIRPWIINCRLVRHGQELYLIGPCMSAFWYRIADSACSYP